MWISKFVPEKLGVENDVFVLNLIPWAVELRVYIEKCIYT